MSFKLIITEKPSVAKDIAKVLGSNSRRNGYFEGNGYQITWCVGHLVGLSYPSDYDPKFKTWRVDTLPIIPKKMKYQVLPQTRDQFNIINELIHRESTESIICATDSGREGELIFRLVYRLSETKKPFQRLWINSQTDQAILKGFETLKPGTDYDPLFKSAISRAVADWLIGINATRYFSVQYNATLSIGRVQTPTLAMVVNRHLEIINFKPEPYYEIEAEFEGYKGTWKNDKEAKILDEQIANDLIERLKGKSGIVESIETSKKSKPCPLLYDLTELQVQANKKYGYTIKETLDIAQALYERHKVTTYPRTDSRYLSDDIIPTLVPLLKNIQREDLKPYVDTILEKKLDITKRIVNNAKVNDHHAIIPTEKVANYKAFSEQEKNIYNMIINRFVAVFMAKYQYNETILLTLIDGEKFHSKGNTVIDAGWRKIESENDQKEVVLPPLEKGNEVAVLDIIKKDKMTKPKKYFTEGTLVSAMANIGKSVDDEILKESLKDKGLGTPATRAGIIEKLLKVGYIYRKKNNLLPTAKGVQTIDIVPDKLKLPEITGEWEYQLNQIAKGEGDLLAFMNGIKKQVHELINTAVDETKVFEESENDSRKALAKCPRCGKRIFENQKSYACEGWRRKPKCTYSIWKEDRFFEDKGIRLTSKQVVELILNKQVKIEYQKNEEETPTVGILKVEDTGRYLNYTIEDDQS